MLKVNDKDTRMTPIFIANFEHISHLVLMFLLLTLNMYMRAGHQQKTNKAVHGKNSCEKYSIFHLWKAP